MSDSKATNHNVSVIDDDRLQRALRTWVVWLRSLFTVRKVGNYRWLPNADETEIFIAGNEPDEGTPGNARPRIIVSRGPANIVMASRDQTSVPWLSTPARTMSTLVGTSLVTTVTSSEGLEAQALAWYIYERILVFREDLIKHGRMHDIATQSMQLTQEGPYHSIVGGTSSTKFKSVQIIVPIYIQVVIHEDPSGFYPTVRNIMTSILTGNSEDDPSQTVQLPDTTT